MGTAIALAVLAALAVPAAAKQVAWSTPFGSTDWDVTQGVAMRGAATYAGGYTYGAFPGQAHHGTPGTDSDAVVSRFDGAGDVVWHRQFGTGHDDEVRGIAASSAGIYAVGYTYGTLPGEVSSGDADAIVRKYGPGGGVIWTDQFGTAGTDVLNAVAADDSGVYVAGYASGSVGGAPHLGNADIVVRKYDHDGTVAWTRLFGSPASDFGRAVALHGGHVFVGGRSNGTLPGESSAGAYDAVIGRFTIDGAPDWSAQFGTGGDDGVEALAAGPGGLYAAGYATDALAGQTSAGGRDPFVRKYAPGTGEVRWTRQFGTSGDDEVGQGLAVGGAGVYVSGSVSGALPGQTFAGNLDSFVRRYSTSGALRWTRQWGDVSYDSAHAVVAGPAGVTAAGGSNDPTNTTSDSFVERLVWYRPDGSISNKAASGYAGNDIYAKAGSKQTKRARAPRGASRTFFVRVQNDGDARDTLRVRGCVDSAGFRVRYLQGATGTKAITGKVVAGTYGTRLAPGKRAVLRAVVRVTRDAKVGKVKTCRIDISSAAQPTRSDRVVAKLTVKG
jgi:hypothetical protein